MNSTLLIDAIVRQTVVLIAALATGAGQRASLSHIADEVFAELVRELKEQGLGNKVIADMFGMALRTYQGRVAQLSESRTFQGRSLWEAVFDYLQREGPVLRAAVHARFARDDSAMVRAVLRDLVDSGLVYKRGRGDGTRYRALQPEEVGAEAADRKETLGPMLLVALHRHGPSTASQLEDLLPGIDPDALAASLTELAGRGLVHTLSPAGADDATAGTTGAHGHPQGPTSETRYRCKRCVIPFGDDAGWEAAVFDHYQAMVAALVSKLRAGRRRAAHEDHVGGSTFVFDIFAGHPMEHEVLGFLANLRTQGLGLRKRLDDYDRATAGEPRPRPTRVVAYVGQMVKETDGENELPN